MKNTKNNDLDNLLYSTSQYQDDDTQSLRKQLNSVKNKYQFNDKNMLDLDADDDDDDGVVLGNGQSVDEGDNWGDDYKDQCREWKNQQNAKYYFRQVAGNSQNFSQSLSIHRPDLLESKAMHENSLHLQTINIQNILSLKKKQQQKVNEVLNTQINDLIQKIEKQQCLIKGYRKKIEDLEDVIMNLRKQNEELDQRIKQYHQNLDKKDQLFNILKEQYTNITCTFDQKEKIEKQLKENVKSMEKEIEKLRNVIKSFTDEEKGLLDFNTNTTLQRRSQSFKSSISSSRQIQSMQAQIQKLKRQKKSLQTDCELAKEDLIRRQQKFRNIEQQLRRKLSSKDKKIKQLSQNIQQNKQQLLKIKKSNESGSLNLKEKIIKLQKEVILKQQKIKQCEGKIKISVEQIKRKEQKIKDLLTQISDKNKKNTELKDVLQQQQARNQIQTKLQKQRQNQIDKLEQEVKDLKAQKFNLKRQLQNLEKPSNIEQKLKKQATILKKQNQSLQKQINELSENMKSLQKEVQAKDQKLRELKKKNDELVKKTNLTKKKSEQTQLVNQLNQQNQNFRELISKMTKQLSQLRKKAQTNQDLQNKLLILQSRIKFNNERNTQQHQYQYENQNQFDLQQINQALKQQLANSQAKIQEMQQLHQKQIQRLLKQNKTLVENVNKLNSQIQFREKSLDYMHQKFVEIQKQNAELKAKKNILHSSFYDDSYEKQDTNTINFYQNKIDALQTKIQHLNSMLKEKDKQLKSEKDSYQREFNQLKNRIKDLQTMALSNQPVVRKIAPESLTPDQTLEFFMKILRRVYKSAQMIRSLSKTSDFKLIIANLWKYIEKDTIKK